MIAINLMGTKKGKRKASLILRVASLALLMQMIQTQPLFTMDKKESEKSSKSKSSETKREVQKESRGVSNPFKNLGQAAQTLFNENEGTRLEQLKTLLQSKEFSSLSKKDEKSANKYTEIVAAVESAKVFPTIRQALAKKLLQMSKELDNDKNTIDSLIIAINKIIGREEEKASAVFQKFRKAAQELFDKHEGTRLEELKILLLSEAFKDVGATDKNAANDYEKTVNAVESAKVPPEIKEALAKKLLQMSKELGTDSNTIESLITAINKLIARQEEKNIGKKEISNPEDIKMVAKKTHLTPEDLDKFPKPNLRWGDPSFFTAADYAHKLYHITEIQESGIENLIDKIKLIYLFQQSEAKIEPTSIDIGLLDGCLNKLPKLSQDEKLVANNPLVQYALAYYVTEKEEGFDPEDIGILVIDKFKDVAFSGKKAAAKSSAFSSPKKVAISRLERKVPEGYVDIDLYKKGEGKDYKGRTIILPVQALEEGKDKWTTIIIFDDIVPIGDKIYVKGAHVHSFKTTRPGL